MHAVFGKERLHGTNPGLLFSICRHKKNAFVSGGSDQRGLIWTTAGARLAQLIGGHSAAVNSVAQAPNGDVVTGAQDGIAVVWRRSDRLFKLEGHQYGVEVAALPSGEICTASGNIDRGVICIWRDSQLIDRNEHAHDRMSFLDCCISKLPSFLVSSWFRNLYILQYFSGQLQISPALGF